MNNTQLKNYTYDSDKNRSFDTAIAQLDNDAKLMYKEVIVGLEKSPKELPSKYFYDELGSQLFDQICGLEEYYLTRTELSIMRQYIAEISEELGDELMLIEYGSGSSEKIKVLLDNIKGIKAYLPIDISLEHLVKSAAQIATQYKDLEVIPVCEDYNNSFMIPLPKKATKRKVVFFPGSTIGNFHPSQAENFLARITKVVNPEGGLLIGVDLKKDSDILNSAYNDQKGITAQFNINQLSHINNKLDANFDLDSFMHDAFYNEREGRIEMHLVSEKQQTVNINGSTFKFNQGEHIWTESSYKYSLDEFAALAEKAGFNVEKVWTDDELLFSVQYLKTTK